MSHPPPPPAVVTGIAGGVKRVPTPAPSFRAIGQIETFPELFVSHALFRIVKPLSGPLFSLRVLLVVNFRGMYRYIEIRSSALQ